MKLIVGLGNPGSEYENTRHNAGFMVLDELARRHAGGAVSRGRFHAATLECMIGSEKVLLAKPTTFMNRSGLTVGEAVRFYKIEPAEDLMVVVDDVYLPLGAIRIRARGGDGGHNGLADVARAVGGEQYARVRVGVDSKPQGASQVGFVLGRFTQEQGDALKPALKAAADAVECWVGKGVVEAMNRYNAPDETKPKGKKPKAEQDLDSQIRPPEASREASRDQTQGAGAVRPAGHQEPNASAKDF
ncbi:MAG: aminoacyl-tRNA hydrolase [Phycisphaeraceae bacterium]|nr:aminoacyl-tRNA hydrolase [Phycisphaeraceae bacterium]